MIRWYGLWEATEYVGNEKGGKHSHEKESLVGAHRLYYGGDWRSGRLLTSRGNKFARDNVTEHASDDKPAENIARDNAAVKPAATIRWNTHIDRQQPEWS